MKLYHTGKTEIREPDIRRGRKNADFGQGFYLTTDMDFARRWAGRDAVVNEYELDTDGLTVYRFTRSREWFEYIFHNRRARDGLSADVVIGPVANDTLFDTLGIISSGLLEPEDAMKLLKAGPEYTQAAVKTERAAKQLRWIRSGKIAKPEEELLRAEREAYEGAFAEAVREITGGK